MSHANFVTCPEMVRRCCVSVLINVSEKAREFYFQRLEEGTDAYEALDSLGVVERAAGHREDRLLLYCEILACYQQDKGMCARSLILRYFRQYGLGRSPLLLKIFAASYLGSETRMRISGYLRKIRKRLRL